MASNHRLPIPSSLMEVLDDPQMPTSVIVGGAVRDWLLGLPPKDLDLECYGISYADLATKLERYGKVDFVGKQFGVCKLSVGGVIYDFSIPRKDSRAPAGTQRDTIGFDPGITPRQAAARRDFTINTLAYNPKTGEVMDFFNGLTDLRLGILRHTSDRHFSEDPIRPLRAFQLSSRLDFSVAPETVDLCRSIRYSHKELPKDRIREEWMKWATKSSRPSTGLQFLRETQYLTHYPSLSKLIGVEQDPDHHPEGDVWNHTLHCCDELSCLADWESRPAGERAIIMFAVLTHDIAKPECTALTLKPKEGRSRITSYGHQKKGGSMATEFLRNEIGIENDGILRNVEKLVVHHMDYLHVTNDKHIRTAATKLEPSSFRDLKLVVAADHAGRPPRHKDMPQAAIAMFARAEEMGVFKAKPEPYLLGRHLIDVGLKPGPQFTQILEKAYEIQLRGDFQTPLDARLWLEMNRVDLEESAKNAQALSLTNTVLEPERS